MKLYTFSGGQVCDKIVVKTTGNGPYFSVGRQHVVSSEPENFPRAEADMVEKFFGREMQSVRVVRQAKLISREIIRPEGGKDQEIIMSRVPKKDRKHTNDEGCIIYISCNSRTLGWFDPGSVQRLEGSPRILLQGTDSWAFGISGRWREYLILAKTGDALRIVLAGGKEYAIRVASHGIEVLDWEQYGVRVKDTEIAIVSA